jgi:hypothetical protein
MVVRLTPEESGELSQSLIAGFMPIGFVVFLEVVDIDSGV